MHIKYSLLFTESLDELTSMVEKLFGEVENKNVPVPEFPEHPFQEEHLRVSWFTTNVYCIFNNFVVLVHHYELSNV